MVGKGCIKFQWTHQVVTRILTFLSQKRAITCSKCRIELSNLTIYIGVIVWRGCIKFQCNALSKYRDKDS